MNRIRKRVGDWRAAGWPGATEVTRRLLEHWWDRDERETRQFFFCQLEAAEAFELEHNPSVTAWVKNDHLGFEILYIYNGVVRKYRPDFIIRMDSGVHVVLEVKEQDSDENRTKRRFLAEWVEAVNAHGGFGR